MKKKIKYLLQIILSIPKTLYFNFRCFNFKIAIRFPVFIAYNVKILEIYKNCVEIIGKKKISMIKIGIGGTPSITSNKSIIYLNNKMGGKIIFRGNAKFSEGISIYNNGGILEIGSNFSCNKNCSFSSDKNIKIGNDCLFGWNVTIRDSDGHKLFSNNKVKNGCEKITIGNHNWICANVSILKNNTTGDDCVISYNSCLVNIKAENNELIAGYPAVITKKNINWEK